MRLFSHLKSPRKAQRGIALVAVLIIAGILVIIALAFYSLGAYEAGLYERRRELTQAFAKAESGVERARRQLLDNQSKSDALYDYGGINVYEVVELTAAGNPTRLGDPLIDFWHDVRISAKGIENGLERELVVIFSPGLSYAVATSQHITFHGGPNDWSLEDALDHVNDAYIEGGLIFDHHINHPDYPYKYDWARPDTVVIPDWLKTMPNFRSTFEPMATQIFTGDQFWGNPGGGNPWSQLPNNSIVYVRGKVDITENVIQNWDTQPVDVTIIATGNITWTNGRNDDDDRLVLIGLQNVVLEGDPGTNANCNAFIAAGNEARTTNIGGAGASGGSGEVNGMVWVCKNIDMRGHDTVDVYPSRLGWNLNQRIETILLNGGIAVLPWLNLGGLFELHRVSWAEVDPEA
jgi:hypothetical protein